MPVSKTDRERLKAMLAQNGMSSAVYRKMTTPTLKRRMFKIAMNRSPDNEATPWAVEISSEDRAKIQEAWIDRI